MDTDSWWVGSAWVARGYRVFGREEKEPVVVEAWVGGMELLGKLWGILFFCGRERGKLLAALFFLLYD